MNIHDFRGTFKSYPRIVKPHTIILHHTAGYHKPSVNYLKQKGFGYHIMIDRDGQAFQYVDINRRCNHAYARNTGTVGICFVAGAPVGPVTDAQIDAVVPIINELKTRYSSIQKLSGHKHMDPRSKRGRYNKIDPTFQGEPANSVNWAVDQEAMEGLAQRTGLLFISARDSLDPTRG